MLICDLDLDDLHESRGGGTVTPRLDRRGDLFQVTASFAEQSGASSKPLEGPLGDQLKVKVAAKTVVKKTATD